ncbi:MAG: hypothetical protein IJM80_03215 [Firmicutes bacterium]|nr:hypothetical protein [Bacillota bacterium]
MASARKTEKQNIAFMELYKSVDVSIKDRFGTADGVSEYIRRLEQLPQSAKAGSRLAGIWQDHRMLKHLRWARNMLAHEASYSDEILKDGDMEWLEDFVRKLRQSKDPLSLLKRPDSGSRKKPGKLSLLGRIRRLLGKG